MSKEIEVVWWGGQRGSWCHGIVEWLTQGFTHRMDVKELRGEGCILVLKADYDKDQRKFIEETAALKWCLLIITANEEGNMVVQKPLLRNVRTWLQTPHRHQEAHVYLPWGWTPNCSVDVESKKELDCSFAGQITHARRWELMSAFPEIAKAMKKWEFHGSDGFAKGISQAEYYGLVGRSKVVPCPSGPMTVDSMRVCEALQLGAIPILDGQSPRGPYIEYWERVFGRNYPLPVAFEWGADFPGELENILENYDKIQPAVSFWWAKYKAGLHAKLMLDLHELGAM